MPTTSSVFLPNRPSPGIETILFQHEISVAGEMRPQFGTEMNSLILWMV